MTVVFTFQYVKTRTSYFMNGRTWMTRKDSISSGTVRNRIYGAVHGLEL